MGPAKVRVRVRLLAVIETKPQIAAGRGLVRTTAVAVGLLLVFVLVSAIGRVATDWPNILAGTVPDDDFAERYVAHPWRAYLHIVPGMIYLFAAPLQLSRRFRTRHYTVHRRLGRVLLGLALLSGVFALLFGVPEAWGGSAEAIATAVFGTWFLSCLVLAFRAIRRDDVRQHRRWMIRAFAVGVGVGTIRVWIGIFTGVMAATGADMDVPLPDQTGFAVAFWLGFSLHVIVGEWWLRRTPALDG